jgi:hypothetical protein
LASYSVIGDREIRVPLFLASGPSGTFRNLETDFMRPAGPTDPQRSHSRNNTNFSKKNSQNNSDLEAVTAAHRIPQCVFRTSPIGDQASLWLLRGPEIAPGGRPLFKNTVIFT